MRDEELTELADLNFAESLREKARWCAAAEAWDAAGTLCVSSATRFPAGPFNATMGSGAGDAGPGLLDRAGAWFGARDRGFTVYVRGARDAGLLARCQAEKLTKMGEMPGMVLETAPPPVSGIEQVSDEAGLASFVDVSTAAWASVGVEPAALRKHFAEPRRVRGPHLSVVLARADDGQPLAAALTLLSHGIAGIYWVGTRPDARGRGLGAAVTASTARWAFERGARAVILQASEQGESVYLRMGFRQITRYPWFVARRGLLAGPGAAGSSIAGSR